MKCWCGRGCCLFHNHKMDNQTDQSNSLNPIASSGKARFIGQLDIPCYINSWGKQPEMDCIV